MSIGHRILLAFALVAFGFPVVLGAQHCAAAPMSGAGTVRVGGALVVGADASGHAGQVAMRRVVGRQPAYAQVTGTRITYPEAFDAEARDARVDPAYGVDLELGLEQGRGRATFCPVLAGGFTSGPEVTSGAGGDELETEAKMWHGAVGGWLGLPLLSSGRAALIAAVGARLVHAWGDVTNDGSVGGVRIDDVDARRDTHGVLSIAVGGVIGSRMLMRPQLDLPLGGADDEGLLLRLGVALMLGP